MLDPPDGVFAGLRRFEELSSGLVPTGSDLLRFFCAMADGGGHVLTADSVALMTADALTDAQREQVLPSSAQARRGGSGQVWASRPPSRGWRRDVGGGTAGRGRVRASIRAATPSAFC